MRKPKFENNDYFLITPRIISAVNGKTIVFLYYKTYIGIVCNSVFRIQHIGLHNPLLNKCLMIEKSFTINIKEIIRFIL